MRMYESIVKGQPTMQPGVPESFNVLLKELQALCLDVELINVEDPGYRSSQRGGLSAAE
jgi:DNA-directed RNA polymerase subunit beta